MIGAETKDWLNKHQMLGTVNGASAKESVILGGEKEFIQGSGLGVHCVDGAKVNVSMGFFWAAKCKKDEGQSRNGASAKRRLSE
ncbi:hypothetical protein B9Z55_006537 [Caenorhabditis nigoni]|uniref:Uncharacterized protein n=1 Tax=Caenorhabditis nigoni TaxID=1611254 RepID=A0A2G5V5M5_9PELO|nr:hypothetical protein B9Z55_006537 [Caenorhabditis nigoni]